MRIEKKKLINDAIIFFLALYIVSLFVFSYDSNLNILSEMLFLATCSLLILKIFQDKTFKINHFYFNLLMLFILSCLSYFWALDTILTISSIERIFQLFLLMLVVYISIDNNEQIRVLLLSICFGGILMSIYSLYYYGISDLMNAVINGYRIGMEINQANTFGYLCSITFLVLVYYALYYKKLVLIVISLFPLLLSIGSGSRRSLLVNVVGLLLLLLLWTIYNEKKLKGILILIFSGASIYFIISKSLNLEIFNRFNSMLNVFGDGYVDNSLNVRKGMIDYGFKLFFENPFLGVGANQYRPWYSIEHNMYRPAHNGFVQTLADFGFVGFVLYYGMFIYLIFSLFNILKNKKEESYVAIPILMLLGIHLLSDTATNSFYDKYTYVLLGISYAYVIINSKRRIE